MMKTLLIVMLGSGILFHTAVPAFAQKNKSNTSAVDTPVRVVENRAFTFGERLKYRVHYGIMNAANIDFEVRPDTVRVGKKNTFHVIAFGRTISAFDWFMKVRDRYETHIDQVSMLPVKYTKDQVEGNYKDQDYAVFNHQNRICIHEKGKMVIEPDVMDLISAIYYFRTFDFSKAKPGDKYSFQVYLDNRLYETGAKFLGREVIKSDVGRIRCIKLRPQLIVDRVFKDANDMTLWVTDDENKIPVRVQSDLRVGSLKVDLIDYKGLRNPLALVK